MTIRTNYSPGPVLAATIILGLILTYLFGKVSWIL